MVKNYLKVAIRSLLKQKSFAAINIFGLAVALAASFLITMFVISEHSYDTFYPDVDRVYRVANQKNGSWTPYPLAKTVREEIPGVASAFMAQGIWEALIKVDETSYLEPGGFWVEAQFLEVFKTEFLSGDPKNALRNKNEVVLTASVAGKFFKDENPISKVIDIDDVAHTVVGIVKDPPKNTHLPYKYLVSEPFDPNEVYYWSGSNRLTYLKLKEHVSIQDINDQLKVLYRSKVLPELLTFTGHTTVEELVEANPDRTLAFTLHPVLDLILKKPHFSRGDQGDETKLLVLLLIAILIILIACINYVNLSISRSITRSKEIGIRKSLGSSKTSIVSQFIVESILLVTFASVIAFLLAGISLELFNKLTDRAFDAVDLFTVQSFGIALAHILLVGTLSGSYPAFVASRFNPVRAIKGGLKTGSTLNLRSVLVTVQFAVSIFLLIATLVIFSQVDHMKNKEIGIEIEQTLVIESGNELGDNYDIFKNELLGLPYVAHVAKVNHIPFSWIGGWSYKDLSEGGSGISPGNLFAEPGVEDVLDIKLAQGRFFKPNTLSDTSKVLVNQAFVREANWEQPIGKKLSRDKLQFEVVGVFNDFDFTSAKNDVTPLLIRYGHPSIEVGIWHQRFILVKLNARDYNKAIDGIEEKWASLEPDYPFSATFLDDEFQAQYKSEQQFGRTFTTFSIIAVIIAILGLLAMTTFILQKRKKEMAIRKVLGASILSLLVLILKRFSILILIGGMIGSTGAFYWLHSWLEDFSYRITLSWVYIAPPITLILILTWLVVAMKGYRSTVANPSIALKEE